MRPAKFLPYVLWCSAVISYMLRLDICLWKINPFFFFLFICCRGFQTSIFIDLFFLNFILFYFFVFVFFKFYFIFKLYIIVLVLPNIKMNPSVILISISDNFSCPKVFFIWYYLVCYSPWGCKELDMTW